MSQPSRLPVSTIAATTTTATGCHMLKFEGYKLLKKMYGNGQYVASCRFEAAGHTWTIYCYPNSYSQYESDYVYLFLVLDDDAAATDAAIHAEVKFSLLRRRGRPHSRSVTGFFGKRYSMLGFSKFIKRGKLESRLSGFLDDCFAVRCDITVLNKSAVKAPTVQASDLEKLGIVCDCTDDLCKGYHVRKPPPPSESAKPFFKFFCLSS
ncbi:hypothetical protein PR202_gb20910 [Eleusine coracana subsp. coracana]|uniref:MATH domain-containing protein n=1 Tax=Eleusine coracana subsp. coracana TaxID=191504 RepID=A0AAV5FBN6_ELECO|nr:hypothetical protein QOZ80_7BG0599920 [Eleusine coracana subsp. coracana]GJN32402.1 hypothetical protein PR202_gb20910 [Eleusine coracana subsp. coracana]